MKQPIEFDLGDPEPAPRVYTCTVCGTTGPWGPTWSWYGAWRDVDLNPEKIITCCSVACRKQHAADNGNDSKLEAS